MGSYRARPARLELHPKPDGTERPLSVLCLEDKIVQQAAVFEPPRVYRLSKYYAAFSCAFKPFSSARTSA